MTKFESGMYESGKMMKIWKHRLISNCPPCNPSKEAPTDIQKCQSKNAQAIWDVSITKLEDWLQQNKTYPDVMILILHGISMWRAREVVTPPKCLYYDDAKRTFGAQQKIGWMAFMRGYLLFE